MVSCTLMGQVADTPTAAPAGTNRVAALKKAKAQATEQSTPFALTMQEPLSPRAPGDFAIAVLPDTQEYTAARNGGKPEMLVAQIGYSGNLVAGCGPKGKGLLE
jgi:hypothetical protein